MSIRRSHSRAEFFEPHGPGGGDPDGEFGCAHSFAGFVSALARTAAIVAEVGTTRNVHVGDLCRSYGLLLDTSADDDGERHLNGRHHS